MGAMRIFLCACGSLALASAAAGATSGDAAAPSVIQHGMPSLSCFQDPTVLAAGDENGPGLAKDASQAALDAACFRDVAGRFTARDNKTHGLTAR